MLNVKENIHAKYTEKITLADGSNDEKTVKPTKHDVRTWKEAHNRRNANLFESCSPSSSTTILFGCSLTMRV